MCLPGEVSARGGVCPGGCLPGWCGRQNPPVNRMTDRCKNITLPRRIKFNENFCSICAKTNFNFLNLSKESQRANQTTLEQLNDLQQDRDRTIQQLQEANKVRNTT